MEAILIFLFCIFGVLQCAMDFAPLGAERTKELFAAGPYLYGLTPTPIGFDPTVYDYNYTYPMCAARRNGPNFVCQLQFTATPGPNCTAQVVPSPLNLTISDILSPKVVTITVTYINGSSSIYRVYVTLLPSTDATLKTLLPSNANLTPSFDSTVLSYQLAALTSTQASITSSISIAEGATLQINGVTSTGPQWTISMTAAKCIQQSYILTVTAEDGVTQNNYTVNAYLPDLTVRPVNGTVTVDTATVRFNAVLDLPRQTLDLYEQVAINSDITLNLIFLQDYSSTKDATVVQLSFLPAPCGSPDYNQHYIDRFNSSQYITFQFRLDEPDNITNSSYMETNISSLVLVYSDKVLYCADSETNTTLYGSVCKPPPPPEKKKISAEVGIAVATALVIGIVLLVLVVDFLWAKIYGEGGSKDLAGLEMRETVSRDETIPDHNKSTTPREAGNTVATATEDP